MSWFDMTRSSERHERMERFVMSWCTVGMPGTKPFFEASVTLSIYLSHANR
jgi:hypothetical protein